MKYHTICCFLYLLLVIAHAFAWETDVRCDHNGVCSIENACPISKFLCENEKCVERYLLCDGEDDCGDNSDEFNCNQRRRHGMCAWMYYEDTTCLRATKFLCDNQKCLDRNLYCNGKNDCGDNSDEEYCSQRDYCRNRRNRTRCDYKCIPTEWVCDGVRDCQDGTDEASCETNLNRKLNGRLKGLEWLYNQSRPESEAEVWGTRVDKSAIALYFADSTFIQFNNGTRKEIAYEVSIQFLSRLSRTKLEEIPSNDLASFLNAFLVSCIDPRKFHGVDIVQELRNRVDRQNFTNPYVLLSLCNAGDRITEWDQAKLIDNFSNKHRTFWTDMQAFSVMALACASEQQPNNGLLHETLHDFTVELKQRQYRNGSIENLQTTALVMQALFSAAPEEDPDNFDEHKAFEQILSSQRADGSFGNLINTYFVLPVLYCKSLVNISTDHCKQVKRDEISALEDLANRSGPKKRVQYSIWVGNEKVVERNLVLKAPLNMSLYGLMEIAAEVDNRYSFEYVVKNRKPYINAVSGLQDNPEKGKFWFLYVMKEGQPTPSQESPADVMPKDNDHLIMWYRSGSWVD